MGRISTMFLWCVILVPFISASEISSPLEGLFNLAEENVVKNSNISVNLCDVKLTKMKIAVLRRELWALKSKYIFKLFIKTIQLD